MKNVFIQEHECAVFVLKDGQKISVCRGDLNPDVEQPYLSVRSVNEKDGLVVRPTNCGVSSIQISTEKTGFKKQIARVAE